MRSSHLEMDKLKNNFHCIYHVGTINWVKFNIWRSFVHERECPKRFLCGRRADDSIHLARLLCSTVISNKELEHGEDDFHSADLRWMRRLLAAGIFCSSDSLRESAFFGAQEIQMEKMVNNILIGRLLGCCRRLLSIHLDLSICLKFMVKFISNVMIV